MTFWTRLGYLLFPWRKRAADRDMQDELQSIAAMSEPRELGNLTRVAEDARAQWSWRWADELGRDIRYAWRTLRKSPAFAATAILSLALGLGAAISIFSLVDAVLLRTLPVRAPGELVLLAEYSNSRQVLSWSTDQLRALRQSESLSGICAFRPQTTFGVSGARDAELASGQLVSGNCFDVLGLSAARGRMLTDDDERAGDARPVAVISHEFWQRFFGGDPDILGRTLDLKGHAVSIVGVTPPGFYGLEPGRTVDITLPMQPWAIDSRMTPNVRWLRLMGRLRTGVPRERAEAELTVRWRAIVAPPRPGAPAARFALLSGAQGLNDLRTQFSLPLRLLLAAVGLLVVLGCANLASLLFARGKLREQELTLRLALGASRGRVVRQLLTESLVLAMLGGTAGLIIATWGSEAIVALLSRGRAPILLNLGIDTRVFVFAMVLSVATSLVFGVWPAIAATRRDLDSRLRAATRTVVGSHRRRAQMLIAAQTVFSMVLVIAAGLFARSLVNLYRVDLGLSKRQVASVGLNPGVAGVTGARGAEILSDFSLRLASAPGVTSVSRAMDLPFGGSSYRASIAVPGELMGPDEQVSYNFVGPRFFETMGIPLIAGRDLGPSDDPQGPPVAVVSQSLASHYFPRQSALGAHVQAGKALVEIVGIAADVPYEGVRNERELVFYRPFLQQGGGVGLGTVVVRSDLSPAALASLVRRTLRDVAPAVPVGAIETLDAKFDGSIATERLLANIAGFFGAMALLLVAIGVYGTIASSVAQRTREFGIRRALGATGGQIVRMILTGALVPVSLGMIVGVPLAVLSARGAEGALFGITSHDPATYVASVILLFVVALTAALVPARVAARADSAVALRQE